MLPSWPQRITRPRTRVCPLEIVGNDAINNDAINNEVDKTVECPALGPLNCTRHLCDFRSIQAVRSMSIQAMRSTNRPIITTSVINRNFSLGIGDALRIPQTVRACPVPLYSSARFNPVRVSQRGRFGVQYRLFGLY